MSSIPTTPSWLAPGARAGAARGARELFALHYEMIRAARDESAGAGYLIVALRHDHHLVGCGLVTFGAQDASHTFVVGSHERADLRLGGDAAVCPSHLLARLEVRGHEPRLRLIDLGTAAGLVIDGGRTARGLSTDRAVAVRIGDYALLFVPLRRVDAPWPESVAEVVPFAAFGVADGPDLLLDGPRALGAADAGKASEPYATVRLLRGGCETTFTLGLGELERGVLLGTPPNVDGARRRCFVLLASREGCLLVDVASRGGIVAHRLDRRATLLGARCVIELDGGDSARFELLARPPTRADAAP